MHVRTRIRTAAGDILAAAIAARVFTSRSRPIGMREATGPALEIFTPRERSTREAGEDDRYARSISMMVVGHVNAAPDEFGGDASSDVADALALAAEKAFAADPTLGGLAVDCWLSETETVLDRAAFAGAAFAQTWIVEVTASLNEM